MGIQHKTSSTRRGGGEGERDHNKKKRSGGRRAAEEAARAIQLGCLTKANPCSYLKSVGKNTKDEKEKNPGRGDGT